MQHEKFSARMLEWYDAHARAMPWRVGPTAIAAGVVPDPYRVWLAEIMLQQTTVVTVGPYFQNFVDQWPNVNALANAADNDVLAGWAGLGYYARARNLLKCARAIKTDFAGRFPADYTKLQTLPGIGPYTAAAICAIAFDQPETVVDGNVERVMARYFANTDPLDKAKPALVAHAKQLTPILRPGDYVQSVMDLGATVCTPKSPGCGICPVSDGCLGLKNGIAGDLPVRKSKPKKPTRRGIVYLACREDGAWLLERRPEKGLLGGMLGWPGSVWGEAIDEKPPFAARWHDPGVEIRHTFTHFHLRLSLRVATIKGGIETEIGAFIAADRFSRAELPTVMRKAFDVANNWRNGN